MSNEILSSEGPYLAIIGLALTFWLLRKHPGERSTYLNTMWLLVLGVAGQLAGTALQALEFARVGASVHATFSIITAIALIRISGFAVFRLLLPLAGRHPPRIIEDLTIIIVYVIYALSQLRHLGVDLTSIIATSAVITAVLAFAMQDTLGNVLGGLALQLDNSVQVGDWIRVDDLTGRVRDIRWRSTLIETRAWETVVIPNSVLMKAKFSILGRREGEPRQWRRSLVFAVDPRVPPARVISTVEVAMRETAIANVARRPEPSCVLFAFEQGNLRYVLRYWLVDMLEDDLTDSAVRVHLFAALQRAGMRVAEPQQVTHVVPRDEAHAENVRQRDLERRLNMLRAVDLFAPLTDNEKAVIAERLQYSPFARGDVITRQGDASHWLYVIAFGEAEVRFEPGAGRAARPVGTLTAGQFFGEMGLLTGEARNATVVAKTDVECYRLDKASFQGLLLSRPEIADEISRVVSSRQPDLAASRRAAASAALHFETPSQPDLLDRIRRFFGVRRNR